MSIRICVVWLLLLLLTSLGVAQSTNTGVIKDIVVSGNKNVGREPILARMKLKIGQPYNETTANQDQASIEQLGYFKSVTVRGVPIEANDWRVEVTVSEFPVVKEIRVVGNSVIPTDKILKAVTIQVGQPFNLTAQAPSAAAIAKLYNDKGYFARAEELAPMEDSPSTVSIVIREMMVNTVGVQGNNRTKNRVMRRLIKTKAGEAFNTKKWDDDLRRMWGTQWFDKVDPVERQTEDGYGIDLLADVKEARTGQATVGITLDPRSSFAGQIRLADTNFNGTGQSVSLGFQQAVSGGGPSVDLSYGNPFFDNHDTSLSVSLYSRLIYRFTGNGFGTSASPTDQIYNERRTGASISAGRPIGERVTSSVGIRAEKVKTGNLTTNNTNGFIQQDGTVASLSLGLNRNRRDVDIDPSRGDWLNLLVEPGYSNIDEIGGALQDQSILGSHTWTRSQLEYRTYFTRQPPRGRQLDAPRRVLAFRARYGYITGKVPFFEQFFAGGSDSIRGYPDDRYWGTQMLLTTLEYRHPIQKSFNLIGFVDYGGAWGGYGTVNDFSQFKQMKLHVGYGLGVGFRTPLGPIRLDFGFNEKGGSRTHFLIGTSF